MEKTIERRVEKRLQYRWPVKFTVDGLNQQYQGQIVDLSSEGMAFLSHADQSSFAAGQTLKASFAVPYFKFSEQFDIVLYERTGYVTRIDKPASQVHRIAIQFASPLFFKPGQQQISEAEIQQRLDAKNLSIIKAEETARAYDEALTKAEKKLRIYAQAKAKIEERLKAEIEDRSRTETKLRSEAEEKFTRFEEIIAGLEEKLAGRDREINKLNAALEKTQKKAKSLEEQLARIKNETNKEITQIKKDTADIINQIKMNLKNDSRQSLKIDLLKKVDNFISDRNKIF